jgi:hypothetical protein
LHPLNNFFTSGSRQTQLRGDGAAVPTDKRLAKKIVRDCFRDGKFEAVHANLAELVDATVEAIMKDAMDRTYRLLSQLSNAMGGMIVETSLAARVPPSAFPRASL